MANTKDVSPRASGPAGPAFEARVATHYALALLAQTEARGLPGVIVERIEFQRGGQGHPLDDIVVKGPVEANGVRRTLEVQAKRSMAFTESDNNFADIVKGVVAGWKTDPNRRFGAAIERTSGPIENGVQEALELARNTADPGSLFTLLNTDGRSNKAMRDFVAAFRKHLADNGVSADEDVYTILNAFSVLHFDYSRPGSLAEHLDCVRASGLLATGGQGHPYDTLFQRVLDADAIGGDLDRDLLVRRLDERGLKAAAAPRLAKARVRIDEMSRLALARIHTTVSGVTLLRADCLRRLEEALFAAATGSRIVEIMGPSGAGKSALMKAAIGRRAATARCLVLSPDRTPAGGWPALRTAFDIDAAPEVFLADLACDGGGLVCIDGLDRFRDEGQRNTVFDLLNAAVATPGVTVLFTAQPGWEKEAASWFGETLLASLAERRRLVVEGLDDEEADALAQAAPALAGLLRHDHPAKDLARNPAKLGLLVSTRLNTDMPLTEAELAWDWWTSGAHASGASPGAQHARTRVLLAVAEGLLRGENLVDVSGQDANAVAALKAENILDQIRTDRVKFSHDLFTDFAVGCALAEAPERVDEVDLAATPPFWMSRAFELACRRLAEGDDYTAWPRLLAKLEAEAGPGWTGLCLLALVRSEQSKTLLARFSETLLEGTGERAARLMKRVVAAHVQPADALFKLAAPAGVAVPEGVSIPSGTPWIPLLLWCLEHFEDLPAKALSAAVDLFANWLVLSMFGERKISSALLERLADILVAEVREWDRPLPRPGETPPPIPLTVSGDARQTARLQLALYARFAPSAAARYLSAIAKSRQPDRYMHQVLEFPGHLPSATPAAFVDAFEAAMQREDTEEDGGVAGRRRYISSHLDIPFTLGKSGISLFKNLLTADRTAGLRLVRGLVARAEQAPDSDSDFVFTLAGKERRCFPAFSYGWSRGRAPSAMVSKALAALEAWAHERVEDSESVDAIVAEIAGDGPIGGALLLVIVDLALCHARLDTEFFVDLATCPDLLALDAMRSTYDKVDASSGGILGRNWRARSPADEKIEHGLAKRPSRCGALHEAISHITLSDAQNAQEQFRKRLQAGVERLGTWASEKVVWDDPQFMVSHALRLSRRENYELVEQTGEDGEVLTEWTYRFPDDQARWLNAQSSAASAKHIAFTRSLALRTAMDKENVETGVSVADAETVLAETGGAAPSESKNDPEPDDPWLARVGAAAFLARFISDERLADEAATLMAIFDRALSGERRPLPNLRYDIMFEPEALAIAGLLFLAARRGREGPLTDLMSAAGKFPENAAGVFTRHPSAVTKLEARILRGIVRIGLHACIVVRHQHFDETPEAFSARETALLAEKEDRLAAELAWLAGDCDEPGWPVPPVHRVRRPRARIRLPGGKAPEAAKRREPQWPERYFDSHTATVWADAVAADPRVAGAGGRDLLAANVDWLLAMNKPAEDEADDGDIERRWTRALFKCASVGARSWALEDRQRLVYGVLDQFADEPFIEAAAEFLVRSDLLYIEGTDDDRA